MRGIRGPAGATGVGRAVTAVLMVTFVLVAWFLLADSTERARASAELLEVTRTAGAVATATARAGAAGDPDAVAQIAVARRELSDRAAAAVAAGSLTDEQAQRLKAAVQKLLSASQEVARARAEHGNTVAFAVYYAQVRPAVEELDAAVADVNESLTGDAGDDQAVAIGYGVLAILAVTVGVMLTERRIRRLSKEASDRTRFEAVVSGSADVIVISDAEGRVRYASPATTAALGIAPGELAGGRLDAHVDDADVALLSTLAERALAQPGAAHGGRVVAWHAEGHRLYLDVLVHRLSAEVVAQPDYALVWTLRNVTGAHVMEQRLRQLAFYDPLTGLPNRMLVIDRLDQALADGAAAGRGVVVLVVDVDGFRDVVDALGNGVGDQILVEVTRRLRVLGPAEQTLARIGPDTFVAVREGCDRADQALVAGQELLATLALPMTFDGLLHRVGCSVGVAWAGAECDGRADAETVLRQAHTALHTVKVRGGGGALLFETSMQARAAERIELVSGLSAARGAGELELVYQPVVDLASGYVGGVEALLRWRHPRLGVLMPEAFVGLAEQNGLIGDIGGWAVAEACRQAASWRAQLGSRAPTTVAVNLSALQLRSPDVVDEVAAALERSGLEPSVLVLEITESVLVQDLDDARNRLAALKLLGVRLAIDDFGVGYSSLSYLHNFPVDVLKIDRSFLGAADPAVLRGVCSLGASLGLRTVGEGVETPEQARTMLEAGCQAAQGFLFAAPGPPEEIEPLLGVVLDVVPERRIALDAVALDAASLDPVPDARGDRAGPAGLRP